MVLKLSYGDRVADPTDARIREALARLDVGRDGEGFAILNRDQMTYIQVSGDKAMGFDMEYQLGSIEEHYRAKREDFTLEEVVRALGEYRDGTIDWSDYGEWSRITW